MHTNVSLNNFLQQHRLPASFTATIQRWYAGLAERVIQFHKAKGCPVVLAINGCQGSGKSTLAAYLEMIFIEHYKVKSLAISLDDFYLRRSERIDLASRIHPLLETRGVPGTHDVALAMHVLQNLTLESGEVYVPRFDKSSDDRYPESLWSKVKAPVDIVIFEGWCVGATPQNEAQLAHAQNELEYAEDKDGTWRKYANQSLKNEYQVLFNLIDMLVMLKAPSFDCVHRWRLEQEQKLAQSASSQGKKIMNEKQLQRFIQHYQRLSEHMLKHLPASANVLYELDESRLIQKMDEPIAF